MGTVGVTRHPIKASQAAEAALIEEWEGLSRSRRFERWRELTKAQRTVLAQAYEMDGRERGSYGGVR
jgi:hypothetical protein